MSIGKSTKVKAILVDYLCSSSRDYEEKKMLKETNAGCVSNDLVAIDANAHGMLPLVFGLFSLFTLIVSVRFNWEILLLAPPLVWFLVVPLCDKYGRDDEFNHCALVSAHDAH